LDLIFLDKLIAENSFFTCTDSIPVGGATYGSGVGEIFLDDLLCRGDETSLFDCPTRSNGRHNCDHSEDAGVRCGGT